MEVLKDIAIGFLVIVCVLDIFFIWCCFKMDKDREE